MIHNVLYSIFGKYELTEDWLKLFGILSRSESIYISTGKGGTGKRFLNEFN